MKELGFQLEREGNSYFLSKDFDDNSKNRFILFLRKQRYTSSEDNFSKEHIREWCDFRAWGENVGDRLVGGEMDFLPFALVKEYLYFFNNLYQTIKYESNS